MNSSTSPLETATALSIGVALAAAAGVGLPAIGAESWQLVVTVAAAFAARILWFLWRRRRAAAWLDEHGHGSS